MPGAAVTAVRIERYHEFTTIPGVKEDITEIVLNVKKLRLKSFATQPVTLRLIKSGAGPVTAADITESADVEIWNPELVLMTIDSDDVTIEMDLTVERGMGKDHRGAGAPHDCLEIAYAGGDRSTCPSKTSSCCRATARRTEVALDKLGGVAWQTRKARLKQRIREMAADLIKVAAERAREAPVMTPPEGAFDEFVARFPYGETEDQTTGIDAVLEDLASGRPMDRLICGDVGFGKTEVALRAAFVAAHGRQAGGGGRADDAARAPAFRDLQRALRGPAGADRARPRASSPPRTSPPSRPGIEEGTIDIVIGTHALLGKAIEFKRAGAAGRRRGAAFRRRAQGAAEGAARGRARADADGDADPAHAATGADRASASCR